MGGLSKFGSVQIPEANEFGTTSGSLSTDYGYDPMERLRSGSLSTNYGYDPTGMINYAQPMQYQPAQNSIIDPTYLQQLAILNQPQVAGSFYNLLGSGLAGRVGDVAPSTGTPGNAPPVADWRGRVQPLTNTTTAGAASSGGGSSSYDMPEPSAWDSMSDAEKAAYYAENPTMAKITQTLQNLFGMTTLGLIQKNMDPEFVQNQQLIAMGINPATASRGTGLIDTVTGQAPVANSGVTANPATGGINVDYGLTTGMNLGGEGLNVPSYSPESVGVSTTPSGGISVDYGISTGNDGLGLNAPSNWGYTETSSVPSYTEAPSVPSYSIAPDTPTSGIGITAPSDPFGYTPSVPSVPSMNLSDAYSSGGGSYNSSSDANSVNSGAEANARAESRMSRQEGVGESDGGGGGGGGGGSGRYCCSRMVHHGLWDVNHEFARLTVWSRKQPRWWRSGYPVWGKIIAKHLLGKVGFWTEVMQAFYDNKVRNKPRTLKSTLGELVIFPGAFVCGMIWREVPQGARLADPKEFA
jgi:hypothetical protein